MSIVSALAAAPVSKPDCRPQPLQSPAPLQLALHISGTERSLVTAPGAQPQKVSCFPQLPHRLPPAPLPPPPRSGTCRAKEAAFGSGTWRSSTVAIGCRQRLLQLMSEKGINNKHGGRWAHVSRRGLVAGSGPMTSSCRRACERPRIGRATAEMPEGAAACARIAMCCCGKVLVASRRRQE